MTIRAGFADYADDGSWLRGDICVPARTYRRRDDERSAVVEGGAVSEVHLENPSSTLLFEIASMASRFPPPAPAPDAEQARPPTFECDACGKTVEGEPAGSGLYVWTRGDETRYEEPPLCARCANAIGLAALAQWELEEDDGE